MKKYRYKEYLAHIFPCMYYGMVCGAVTGALIFLFKFCANKAAEISEHLYEIAVTKPLYIAITFVILAICGLLMHLLHKYIPESKTTISYLFMNW